MRLLSHLFGLQGTVGRASMWELYVVRTLLGVGFVKLHVSDATWDDTYKLVLGVLLFWPVHVALPIKRLRDLGRTWRTWAGVWTSTAFVSIPAVIFAVRSGDEGALTRIGDFPVSWAISPDAAPPIFVFSVLCAITIQLLYGVFFYFVPGHERTDGLGHAVAS